MKFIFLKFYTKIIRKIIRHRYFMPYFLKYAPKFFAYSESFYIQFKDNEYQYLDILCDRNKNSLDIGVLWGGYTVTICRYSKKVYCFEPIIENYEFLVRAFKNDRNIIVQNVAVSNENSYKKIRIPRKNPGNATIEQANRLDEFNDFIVYHVKTITIDSLNLRNIGFIKIDIEGHELSALEGMKNTLIKYKPRLLVEIENRHNDCAIEKVAKYLEDLNYELFFVKNKKLQKIENFDWRTDQNKNDRNTKKYINNFIGLHQSLMNEFKNSFQNYM